MGVLVSLSPEICLFRERSFSSALLWGPSRRIQFSVNFSTLTSISPAKIAAMWIPPVGKQPSQNTCGTGHSPMGCNPLRTGCSHSEQGLSLSIWVSLDHSSLWQISQKLFLWPDPHTPSKNWAVQNQRSAYLYRVGVFPGWIWFTMYMHMGWFQQSW